MAGCLVHPLSAAIAAGAAAQLPQTICQVTGVTRIGSLVPTRVGKLEAVEYGRKQHNFTSSVEAWAATSGVNWVVPYSC
jgi:hypothetical protein